MSERRALLVEKVFTSLDCENKGIVLVSDVLKRCNVEQMPDFLNHVKSKEQIIDEFKVELIMDSAVEGQITHNEFMWYFEDFSMSIPSDSKFVETIYMQWGSILIF